MIYNQFKDKKISALGLGCMRLPTIDGDSNIDEQKTCEMVEYAMKSGINYYDTAWGYHGGNSESVMGRVLSKYPRESFYLASKFPGYDKENIAKAQEIFERQLEKCKTDYFDFYLFHCLTDSNAEGYCDTSNGLCDFLVEQKKRGRIKHLGFSTHSSLEVMKHFMSLYGEHIEFCQIQLNWLDYSYQQAKDKVDYLNSHGIPIWVMEPVRGGSLCSLAPKYERMLKEADRSRTIPQWGFYYLQAIKGVTVTLSGMSNFEQLQQNLQTYSTLSPLSDKEIELLYSIADDMTAKKSVPCTACRYCTTRCPAGLDIPELIKVYNESGYSDGGFIEEKSMQPFGDKRPSSCIACRACEGVCPQAIKVSEVMADFALKLK